MALPDLTGLNIEDTYHRLLQVSGSNFYDGTGSAVTITSTDTLQDVATRGSQTTIPITASALNVDEIQFNDTNLYGNPIFHGDVNVYSGSAFLDEYDHSFFISNATSQGIGNIQFGSVGIETRIYGNGVNVINPLTASTISCSGELTGTIHGGTF